MEGEDPSNWQRVIPDGEKPMGRGDIFPLYAKKPAEITTSYYAFAANCLDNEDLEDGDLEKTVLEECNAWINECMDRPNTEEELREKISTFKLPTSKEAYADWYKRSRRLFMMEVALAMLTNKIYLRYTPLKCSHAPKFDDKDRALYEALVEREDGTSFVTAVANDWVE